MIPWDRPSACACGRIYSHLFELAWLDQHTRQPVPRVGLLLLLKTFQRLGYFPKLSEVPTPLWHHCAEWAGAGGVPGDLLKYDSSSVRRRHMPLVRKFVGVTAWGKAASRRWSWPAVGRNPDVISDLLLVQYSYT